MKKVIIYILFMIGAFIFNLALLAAIYLGITSIIANLYGDGEVRDIWPLLTNIFAIIVSIVVTLISYNKLIKWGRTKFKLDEKIFGKKLRDN